MEKHGQHKLGQGGYHNLSARIGNDFQEEATDEDLKLDFKYGFQHVLEHRKILEQTPVSPLIHLEGETYKSNEGSGTEPVPRDGACTFSCSVERGTHGRANEHSS